MTAPTGRAGCDLPGADTTPPSAPGLRLTLVPATDGGADLRVELDRSRCGPVTIRLTCARTGEEAVARLSCGDAATAVREADAPAVCAASAAPPADPPAAPPPPRPTAPDHPVAAPSAAQVRAWARRQGMSVADVGRIPTEIVEEYLAAAAADPGCAADPAAPQDHRPE